MIQVPEIIGNLGLGPQIASLLWAALGGVMLWQKLRTPNGNGHLTIEVFREGMASLAAQIDDNAKTRDAARDQKAMERRQKQLDDREAALERRELAR